MANASVLPTITEVDTALGMVNPLVIQIIIAVIIFLMGIVAGKIAQKLFYKILELTDIDRIVKKQFHIRASIAKIVSTLLAYCVYVLFTVIALNRIGLTTTLVTTIAALLAVVLILSLIFGLNDMFANFFAGIAVRLRRQIVPGDVIRIKERRIEGTVCAVSWFHVQIERKNDEIIYVPNMILFKYHVVKVRNKGSLKK